MHEFEAHFRGALRRSDPHGTAAILRQVVYAVSRPRRLPPVAKQERRREARKPDGKKPEQGVAYASRPDTTY